MNERRASFDLIAQQYDQARPTYPPALFDDIVAYADLGSKARLLEIGCGSGQATLPFAQRGYPIDCIELGGELAAIAREKLKAFRHVKVIKADFETAALPPRHYDLVYAATAFHWIEPAIGFKKAHNLLKPGGALALFWHRPVLTDTSRNHVHALQEIYRRRLPKMARDYEAPPPPHAVQTEYDALIPQSGCFDELVIRKHYVLTKYSAAAYISLLATFSDHIALPAATRQRLFKEIAALIRQEFADAIPRETVALLYLARRKCPGKRTAQVA